tara:strand:- start:698 stop:1432 length:735 start_codon:yes stop_codon:yes gene_type:complete
MENSNRMSNNEKIKTLCNNTFLQVNRGWKKCSKATHITSAAKDLIDAYKNVFLYCKNIYEPILILEDDAIVLESQQKHYEEIDNFISHAKFDIYSLGSVGFVNPFNLGVHKSYLYAIGYSQAVIWSRTARMKALSFIEKNCNLTHVDVHIMSKMQKKYSYYIPMVVQLFPETENQENWCYFCTNTQLEKTTVKAWIHCLHLLNLHKKTDNWHVLYFISNNLIRIVLISVIFFIFKGKIFKHSSN